MYRYYKLKILNINLKKKRLFHKVISLPYSPLTAKAQLKIGWNGTGNIPEVVKQGTAVADPAFSQGGGQTIIRPGGHQKLSM